MQRPGSQWERSRWWLLVLWLNERLRSKSSSSRLPGQSQAGWQVLLVVQGDVRGWRVSRPSLVGDCQAKAPMVTIVTYRYWFEPTPGLSGEKIKRINILAFSSLMRIIDRQRYFTDSPFAPSSVSSLTCVWLEPSIEKLLTFDVPACKICDLEDLMQRLKRI